MKNAVIQLPKFTEDARKRWNQIPNEFRVMVLDNVFCHNCRTGSPLQLHEAKMAGSSLVLKGVCKICGSEAARVVEPDE